MSMAMKYAMQKRARKGGACDEHGQEGCGMCYGGKMAEGGEVDNPDADLEDKRFDDSIEGDHDLVDRIMKGFAKGGEVKAEEPTADFEDNDFDVMPLEDTSDADYTGENSGDELGNDQEDDDRRDIVVRIMKSRKKKDRMPRPA